MAAYTTLKALVQAEPAALQNSKLRPYRVETEGGLRYVLANSPGNAALSVCQVETVKPKELQSAALDVLCENAKHQPDFEPKQKGKP